MDVGDLLRSARARAGWNQRVFAMKAQTSQAQVARYEGGVVSPTVATLDRLLAACGLQLRVRLEPLLAEVDERVDALLSGEGVLDTSALPELVRTLDDHPDAVHGGIPGRRPKRVGPVPWAFDGPTALLLHGLAVEEPATTLVVVWGDAARYWLIALGATARNARGDVVSWRELDIGPAREAVSRPFFTFRGILQLRLVEQLPGTTALAVPWCDQPVPVVGQDEVEQHYPEHAEVLARLRQRRSLES